MQHTRGLPNVPPGEQGGRCHRPPSSRRPAPVQKKRKTTEPGKEACERRARARVAAASRAPGCAPHHAPRRPCRRAAATGRSPQARCSGVGPNPGQAPASQRSGSREAAPHSTARRGVGRAGQCRRAGSGRPPLQTAHPRRLPRCSGKCCDPQLEHEDSLSDCRSHVFF